MKNLQCVSAFRQVNGPSTWGGGGGGGEGVPSLRNPLGGPPATTRKLITPPTLDLCLSGSFREKSECFSHSVLCFCFVFIVLGGSRDTFWHYRIWLEVPGYASCRRYLNFSTAFICKMIVMTSRRKCGNVSTT